MRIHSSVFTLIVVAACGSAVAAPITYVIDPRHTYPSFQADHFGGVSYWRGKFNETSGTIVLDREARTGSVEVTIKTASVNTGLADMDKHLRSAEFFDVEKFPVATYKGKFGGFKADAPTEVQGELTIRDVTRPVTLTLSSFKCIVNPMSKKPFCGADAQATFNREDFGMTYGKSLGFDMKVTIAIQVEAAPADAGAAK